MKTLITILFGVTLLTSCGQTGNNIKSMKNSETIATDTIKAGWSNDVNGLIDHLNTWYKDELDAYERPNAYPNFNTSGETNGWIIEHKRKLKELGATIFWNKEKKLYELKKE